MRSVGVLVQSVCAETASCDLTAVVLATSIEEVQRALEAALARQESSVGRQDEIVVMAGRGQGDSLLPEPWLPPVFQMAGCQQAAMSLVPV